MEIKDTGPRYPLGRAVPGPGELEKLVETVSRLSTRYAEKLEALLENPVMELDEENFDKALSEYKLLVVDFWAEWCAPCVVYEPMFLDVARRYAEPRRVGFARLNIDDAPRIADRYGVDTIPATLLFVEGAKVDALIGAVTVEVLERAVKEALKRL